MQGELNTEKLDKQFAVGQLSDGFFEMMLGVVLVFYGLLNWYDKLTWLLGVGIVVCAIGLYLLVKKWISEPRIGQYQRLKEHRRKYTRKGLYWLFAAFAGALVIFASGDGLVKVLDKWFVEFFFGLMGLVWVIPGIRFKIQSFLLEGVIILAALPIRWYFGIDDFLFYLFVGIVFLASGTWKLIHFLVVNPVLQQMETE